MGYSPAQNILDNAPVTTTADVVVFTLNMRDAWRFLLDIISELPFSVRSQYQTDKECAMDFIEAYLAGKQC